MAFYLVYIFSGIISFFAGLSKKTQGALLGVIALILALFAGTRGNIDNDYNNYLEVFVHPDASLQAFLSRTVPLEWCMYFIPKLWHWIAYSQVEAAQFCFLTFAFLGVIFKVIAIHKYARFVALSMLLYVSNLFIMQEMTTIRVGVAAGLFLLSVGDLEQNRKLAGMVKYAIGLFFHSTSALFMPLWFFLQLKIKIRYYYYALGVAFAFALLKINLVKLLFLDKIFPRIDLYLKIMEVDEEMRVATNIFNFRILFALVSIVLMASCYKLLARLPYFDKLFRIQIIGVILFFVMSPTSMVFSLRSYELFSIVQILLYPYLVYVFKPRGIGIAIVLIYSLIQIWYFISVVDIYKPYQSWLF